MVSVPPCCYLRLVVGGLSRHGHSRHITGHSHRPSTAYPMFVARTPVQPKAQSANPNTPEVKVPFLLVREPSPPATRGRLKPVTTRKCLRPTASGRCGR